MKIVFFVREFPVYSETFIIDQIIGLIDRGFDVSIITLAINDQAQSKSVSHYKLMDKVQLISANYGHGIKANILSLFDVIKSLGNKVFRHYLYDGLKHKKRGVEELATIMQHAPKISADAIIAHFGPNAVMAMKLTELGVLKGKIHAVFHGYDMSRYDFIDKYLPDYKRLFKIDMLALPISHYWKEKLIEFGCPDEKILVNRMGVDISKFSFKPKEELSTPINILTVARHTEKKGIEYAIEAMAELNRQGVDFIYNIVGTGPLLEKHYKLIEKHQLTNKVHLLGFKEHQEINSLLENSDIFLLPSVTAPNGDKEGVPVSLMEAMAKGVICLSTYHSGIPELITDNESGFLVDESNSLQIAEKIMTIMQSELGLIQNRARSIIQNEFNQKIAYQQLELALKPNYSNCTF
ncbi:glycosyltransferase [Paraglaciecola sp. L3A3]|uniref:glycosyltransferase n=1 Tax=Paraglaciecola sp. L3A3 TaxID=2686358 RepID=UPI00131EA5A0|nr:glycosyltransferase [Paraglaciecola sp. L3A3]